MEDFPQRAITGKWSIAIARIAQFIANLPQTPSEVHVSKFHDIVHLLQGASVKAYLASESRLIEYNQVQISR